MNTKRIKTGLFLIPLLFLMSAACPEHTVIREAEPQASFTQEEGEATGRVIGIIPSFEAGTVVTLEGKLVLFTCHPDPLTGAFEIKSVDPGIYTLHVYEKGNSIPFSISGIEVKFNQTVNLGPIHYVL